MASMTTIEPGWYPDPADPATQRYWDGGAWTEIWDIATRQANGNLYWLMVEFAAPVTAAEFLFSTKVGYGFDGYGNIDVAVLIEIPRGDMSR